MPQGEQGRDIVKVTDQENELCCRVLDIFEWDKIKLLKLKTASLEITDDMGLDMSLAV